MVALVLVAGVAFALGRASAPGEASDPIAPPSPSGGKSATPDPTVSPSPIEQPSQSPVGARSGRITLRNLTSGIVDRTPSAVTAPIDPPPDTLLLAHVFSFYPPGPEPPTVSSGGTEWTLVVGNQAGEKRHWVYRAMGSDAAGPVTIDFGGAVQNAIMWVVDAASGVDLGNDGADAIAQTVAHESQMNATEGTIALAPLEHPADAVVCFALAGSGAATDIVPETGYTKTAQAETKGANLIIATFWERGGGDTTPAAVFQDPSATPQIQSWLFLAIELRASP